MLFDANSELPVLANNPPGAGVEEAAVWPAGFAPNKPPPKPVAVVVEAPASPNKPPAVEGVVPAAEVGVDELLPPPNSAPVDGVLLAPPNRPPPLDCFWPPKSEGVPIAGGVPAPEVDPVFPNIGGLLPVLAARLPNKPPAVLPLPDCALPEPPTAFELGNEKGLPVVPVLVPNEVVAVVDCPLDAAADEDGAMKLNIGADILAAPRRPRKKYGEGCTVDCTFGILQIELQIGSLGRSAYPSVPVAVRCSEGESQSSKLLRQKKKRYCCCVAGERKPGDDGPICDHESPSIHVVIEMKEEARRVAVELFVAEVGWRGGVFFTIAAFNFLVSATSNKQGVKPRIYGRDAPVAQQPARQGRSEWAAGNTPPSNLPAA